MRILFLGQNPSAGHPQAFVGTKSGARLLKWIDEAGIPKEICDFANVVEDFTMNNARPKMSDFSKYALARRICSYDAIAVCGEFARKAVKSTAFFNKPDIAFIQHPSGLNRNLNSKDTVREQIRVIKDLYEVSRARQG